MKRLVVLSGSGVSAESGIKTFRDHDGLWENFRIEEVATPEAWRTNPERVLDFYNQRRRQAQSVWPNRAHYLLAELEAYYDVQIITQNVDDLHEQAGSTKVLHLHGELMKARSTANPDYVVQLETTELNWGDSCPQGSQLRPHIVWFGEEVPLIPTAIELTQQADIFVIVGTSLAVYPAAGLVNYVSRSTPIYLIDPVLPESAPSRPYTHFASKATEGMEYLFRELVPS